MMVTVSSPRDIERELLCIRADRAKIRNLGLVRRLRGDVRMRYLEWDTMLAARERELERRLEEVQRA